MALNETECVLYVDVTMGVNHVGTGGNASPRICSGDANANSPPPDFVIFPNFNSLLSEVHLQRPPIGTKHTTSNEKFNIFSDEGMDKITAKKLGLASYAKICHFK